MRIQVYKVCTKEVIATIEVDDEATKVITGEDYRVSIDGEEFGFDEWYESLDDFK